MEKKISEMTEEELNEYFDSAYYNNLVDRQMEEMAERMSERIRW